MTDVYVSGNYLRISPRKAKLICDVIRGVAVDEALVRLQFSGKKAGFVTMKLLKSAIANAVNNFKLSQETLYVAQAYVGQGPKLKRLRFVSRGRVSHYAKNTAHISLLLRNREDKERVSLTKVLKSDRKSNALKEKSVEKNRKIARKAKV